jgi:hypothetical protein
MLRRTLMLASLATMCALPLQRAVAQVPMTSIGVAAGGTIPSGDFKDATNTGYHALLTLHVHPPLSPVGLRLDGMFNDLDVKSSTGSDGKAKVWAATANAVVSTGLLGPYFIGGVGYYHTTFSDRVLSLGDASENKFGFNGGVGVRLPLTGFSAFAEARYHYVADSQAKVRLIPISVGIEF